jgi:hypothetical protein
MQNLRFFHVRFEDNSILDAYIYCGNIICITKSGDIKTLPLINVFRNFDYNNLYSNLAYMALIRNDWFDNSQGSNFFSVDTIKESFFSTWNNFALSTYEFKAKEQWVTIGSVSSMPIYDIKAYGFKLFLGAKDGLYEAPLMTGEYKPIKLSGKIEKKFDSRVIGLSARNGEVAISAGSEGLFHGSLWDIKGTLKVEEKRKSSNSLRTNWMESFNLMNYERQNNFSYLVNNVKTEEKKRPFRYSSFDDSSNKIRIDRFGDEIISMEALMSNNKQIRQENILYAFNSSRTAFLVLNDGNIISTNMVEGNTYHLSSKIKALPKMILSNNKVDDIMSVNFIHGATIIEYFGMTVLIKDNMYSILAEGPVISVRTFPSSKRSKKMIAITDEKGLSLFVIPVIKGSFYGTMDGVLV